MEFSEKTDLIIPALIKAWGAIEAATKDAKNDHFKSRYADLAAVLEVIREPLRANNLAPMQPTRVTELGVEVDTYLFHTSGQWVRETLLMPLPNNANAHVIGSAQTYGRRYGLNGVCCLVAEDDDGNAAVQAQDAQETKRAKPAKEKVKVVSDERIAELIAQGDTYAKQGYQAFLGWWQGLSNDERLSIHISHVNAWKQMTVEADESHATQHDDPNMPEHDPETGEIRES